MEKISVVILCGGKSRRMGKDKSKLMLGSETFLEKIAGNFAGAGELLLSVGERTDLSLDGVKTVKDLFPGGPLAGIHAALSASANPVLFVTACDMPFIDKTAAEEMYPYLSKNTDAVIPVGKNQKKQVLAGFYRKRAAEIIETNLRSGNYKIQDVLSQLKVKYVSAEMLTEGERKLRNINTPDDYALVLREREHTPVYSVVGYSGSGKTSFLEKLIPELKAYGLRVAVVKHDAHDFEIDKKGKDSYRLTQAGADVTGVISKKRSFLMENRCVEPEEIIQNIKDVDIILTEGFKTKEWPKIMVYRKEAGQPFCLEPGECVAVVSDVPLKGISHVYDINDVKSIAKILSEGVSVNDKDIIGRSDRACE